MPGAELLETEPEIEEEAPQQETAVMLPIPSSMWISARDRILDFLRDELTRCEAERSEMMDNLARWMRAYDAPMAKEPKNFPIHNASNLVDPLIKEHVHTIVGQLIQSTLQVKPPWILKDLAIEWEPFIPVLQQFLEIAAERDLGFYEEMVQAIVELAVLGTSVVEVGYRVEEKKIYRYSADGKKVYPKLLVTRDGPSLKHVPLRSFWIRMSEVDPEEARWCAKRLLLSKREIDERAAVGKFIPSEVEALYSHYSDPGSEGKEILGAALEDSVKRAESEDLGQRPLFPDRFEIFEIFLSFDVDGDGRYEELKLFYHRETETFLSRTFLPYWNGKRGLVKTGYFPRADRFYDEGIAEMLEQLQANITSIVNRRNDNATLANLKMIIKRKMMKGLQPGDPLYSGKIIEANDVWNDVREFTLSEIYPSTVSEEQIARGTAMRLSGLSEATTGSAMPVSRTTAAAQLALLQEQRNRIGLTVQAIRNSIAKIGTQVNELYSQFGTNGKALAWLGERGRLVEAVYRLPNRVTEIGLAIRVSAESSQDNAQVKRENSIAMFNLLTQMYEKFLPLVQNLAPEALPEVSHALVKSAHIFMGDVLESFDSSDPEGVLQGLALLEKILPDPGDLGGMESYTRAAETSALIDKLAGVEALAREAEADRGGSDRVRPGEQRARRNAPPERASRGDQAGLLFGGDSLFRSR